MINERGGHVLATCGMRIWPLFSLTSFYCCLFVPGDCVKYLPLLVEHVEFQGFLVGGYERKTGVAAAEDGAFDRLDLAAQRTG